LQGRPQESLTPNKYFCRWQTSWLIFSFKNGKYAVVGKSTGEVTGDFLLWVPTLNTADSLAWVKVSGASWQW